MTKKTKSIDWTGPLELMDGTPVRLEAPEPVRYTIFSEDGSPIPISKGNFFAFSSLTVDEKGRLDQIAPKGTPRRQLVRNRKGHVAPKHPATIIRDLLEHAVYDRERNDECIAAVDAAEKWLAQQGED